MLYLYFVLLIAGIALLAAGIVEQRRHYAALHVIPSRVLVNGIRGKSSITRLCAGALRGGDLVTVAKTTGTAARFIHPDATEEPVYRKFGIANVVEQIGIVRRAATYRPDALVIECMAVMPALQEVNQSKLIRSTIGVLCNVREDHLAEMGPTLDDVARSLCRSMPENGICVTAEKDRFDILQEEADARNCELVYADPETVSDEELRGFSWFTFKENVAIALKVAELLGVERKTALQGMYDAPPDPGVLSVERYVGPEGKRLAFANVFAANDPESTLMNINQLLDLGAISRPLNVVINCRPDRVERNGQMGEIIPDLQPDNVFVIGHPSKSAIEAIPAEWRDRAVDLGGERREAEEFMPTLLGRMADGSSLVAIGNIHGQGEELLEYLAELPADESAAEDAPGQATATTGQHPRLDPYASYPVAAEERYQVSQTQGIPVITALPTQATRQQAPAAPYAGAAHAAHQQGHQGDWQQQPAAAQQQSSWAAQQGQQGWFDERQQSAQDQQSAWNARPSGYQDPGAYQQHTDYGQQQTGYQQQEWQQPAGGEQTPSWAREQADQWAEGRQLQHQDPWSQDGQDAWRHGDQGGQGDQDDPRHRGWDHDGHDGRDRRPPGGDGGMPPRH
ncbi:poly-gamma-glutamate synthase PgsB [Streptomyces solincola]|uniref:Poly-gamma-glutamate synthase PgsB n=1 Tax=Streptomyces solincola TaxID=2100817 RepID=A0A2S9Q2V1_9ACTN|nr:poly-gamma-glutamate synthase PgsB [Streptomyces solincola]PRH80937.1 poly-gamma-glutamate synthase PgsB [Streptomyces solincola]